MYEMSFENQVTQPSSLKYFFIPNPWALYFFSFPTIFSSAPTPVINNDRSTMATQIYSEAYSKNVRTSVEVSFQLTQSQQ